MRYLYKINSAYDGFSPKRIPERVTNARFLTLGWQLYLDAIHLYDEVWIVFVGRGFQAGVYIEGVVSAIGADAGTIEIRIRRSSTETPLTDAPTSAALLAAVSRRYRQVFLWPADLQHHVNCTLNDCGQRLCRACELWESLPTIVAAQYAPPSRLQEFDVVPAFWIVPPRCYLYRHGRTPALWNRQTTEMFAAFKVGEGRYAFPFAAGIDAALRQRGIAGHFDAIIPIPLSPDKREARELDRTEALARELEGIRGVPVRQYLSLSAPISKRRMQAQGYSAGQFRARYAALLEVDGRISQMNRVIVLDDVITKGSTLSVATAKIRAANPDIEIVVVAAGQMILTDVVTDPNGPAW